MEKVTVSKAEFEMMAEKNCVPLDPAAESVRLRYEGLLNDLHDVMEEMMKPEHDEIFPAVIASV